MVTINTVCEAIKSPFEYGLSFNKVTKPVIKKLSESRKVLEACLVVVLTKKPILITFIEFEANMHDKDAVYFSSNSPQRVELVNLINNLPAKKIPKKKVKDIEFKDYDNPFSVLSVVSSIGYLIFFPLGLVYLYNRYKYVSEVKEKLRELSTTIPSLQFLLKAGE